MKIAIRPETCDYDMERLKNYTRDIGVDQLWYFPSISSCYGDDGMMDAQKLTVFKDDLQKGGLTLSVTSELIDPKVLRCEHDDEAERIQRAITASAKASIDTFFIIPEFFSNVDGLDPKSSWSNFIEFYKRIIDTAEKVKVKIGMHGLWFPKHVIYNTESYERLFHEIPSDYNGITLCPGCLFLAKEDIIRFIKKFREKIFFAHIRDMAATKDGAREVFPGDGDINVPKMISTLIDIGYEGLLCPEHFPRVVDEPNMGERATAMCVGYLKGLLTSFQDRSSRES